MEIPRWVFWEVGDGEGGGREVGAGRIGKLKIIYTIIRLLIIFFCHKISIIIYNI